MRMRRRSRPGSWALLVYLVADEADGVFTDAHVANEVAAIGAALARHPTRQIAVQADVRDAGITRHFVVDGKLARKDLPQEPPGDVNTIRDFINFGMSTHPAEHHLLVFWGHGFGPAGLKYGRRFVSPRDLRKAFPALRPTIDIVTFMSCQMNTLELAYEFGAWPLLPFTKVANHVIASQGSVKPSETFPYGEILPALGDGMSVDDVALRVVDSLNTRNGARDGSRFAAPFSLVNVGSARSVADALKPLVPDIVSTNPFDADHAKLNAVQEAMHDVFASATTHDASLLDVGRLARGFGQLAVPAGATPSVRALAQRARASGTQLTQALEGFVTRIHAGNGHETTGVSVFCPTHHNPGTAGGGETLSGVPNVETAVAADLEAYRRSSFAMRTKWNEVVDQARDA